MSQRKITSYFRSVKNNIKPESSNDEESPDENSSLRLNDPNKFERSKSKSSTTSSSQESIIFDRPRNKKAIICDESDDSIQISVSARKRKRSSKVIIDSDEGGGDQNFRSGKRSKINQHKNKDIDIDKTPKSRTPKSKRKILIPDSSSESETEKADGNDNDNVNGNDDDNGNDNDMKYKQMSSERKKVLLLNSQRGRTLQALQKQNAERQKKYRRESDSTDGTSEDGNIQEIQIQHHSENESDSDMESFINDGPESPDENEDHPDNDVDDSNESDDNDIKESDHDDKRKLNKIIDDDNDVDNNDDDDTEDTDDDNADDAYSNEEEDGEETDESSNGMNVQSALDSIKADFLRQTDKDIENTNNYYNSIYGTPKTNVKKGKKILKRHKIYQPLVRRLRRKTPGGKKLSDEEVVDQWKWYAVSEDKDCEGKCICKKTGLRYYHWIHNEHIEDVLDQTFSKIYVGSECVHWFIKSSMPVIDEDGEKIDNPLILFDSLIRKGVRGVFSGTTLEKNPDSDLNKNERALLFTITGKIANYIQDNASTIRYILPISVIGDSVQITIFQEKMTRVKDFKKGEKYQIRMSTKLENKPFGSKQERLMPCP